MRTAEPGRRRGGEAGSRGFSLIELMIVVTIVGILASIAYPSYRAYVLKSNRTDAMRALTNDAQILQRCYSQTFDFTSASCPTLPSSSANAHYAITEPTLTAGTFTLTATASGSQAADSTCNTFSIDQTGRETALDSASADQSSKCWGAN